MSLDIDGMTPLHFILGEHEVYDVPHRDELVFLPPLPVLHRQLLKKFHSLLIFVQIPSFLFLNITFVRLSSFRLSLFF